MATVPAAAAPSTPGHDPVVHPEPDEEAKGFGIAIVVGSAIGIAIFIALIAAIVVAQWDLDAWSVAGIAVWTGLWAGLFLGGSVAVGRWSAKNMH